MTKKYNEQQEQMWELCEKMTEAICKNLDIIVWKRLNGEDNFTDEAQGIFNDLVDLTDNLLDYQEETHNGHKMGGCYECRNDLTTNQ